MLVILNPNYRFHHRHPSSPFGFIICIRVIMAFAKAVEGRREIRIFLSNHWHILVRKWLQQYRIIFVVTLIACVRFGTVEKVEAFHKAADHILTHGEWNVKLHCMGPKFVGHSSAMHGPFGVWGQREIEALLRCPAVSVLGSSSWEIRQRYRSRPSRKSHQSCRTGLWSSSLVPGTYAWHCGKQLLIDMKIYLGDRLLWRGFTYDLYMKIVLGFLSKVFTYDQGTKPAALRWSQKAPFFLTRKNVIFWIRKNSVFSHSPTEVVSNPKSTVKKHDHEKEK